MDHLLLPLDPISPRPRVPYVCSVAYDEGDFLDYPNRAGEGWHRVLPAEDGPLFWIRELNDPIDDEQLESFFQCWIFFGLLHELLSPYGLYNAEDYLGNDEQGRFVHTRGLGGMLRQWCDHARTLDEQAQMARKLRLVSCMKLAYDALSCLSANRDEPTHGHPGFSRPIRLSILSICETISTAGDMILDVLPDVDWLYFSRFATFNDDEKTLMREHGWCPSLIIAEEKRFTSIALYAYLLNMRQPLKIDHSECSDEDCKNIQIDTKTYTPRHTEESCTCDAIGPRLSAVAECLNDNCFPVLDVVQSTDEEVQLDVLPHRDGVAYVALSHVWVDGLGNPADITLPACQIRRLQTEIQSIRGQTFTWLENNEECRRLESRHLYLWCDTLLCPIQVQPDKEMTEEERKVFDSDPAVELSKQLKTAALSHMRDVYTKATYVLVLDRALEQTCALNIRPEEAAIYVLTSRWMQRLWTYQEAALPTKLLIKFADTVLDFRDLMLQMLPTARKDPMLRSIALVVLSRCRDLRSYQSLRTKGGPDLTVLQTGILHRGVTYPSDEPLCAGTILGLDLAKIAQLPTGEARMAVLWRLYSETPRGVPQNIIFNKSKRLPDVGYRWAPSSLRQQRSQGLSGLTARGNSRRATLSNLGLSVQYSGWRIELAPPVWGAIGTDWRSLSGPSNYLHVQRQDGRWFSITKSHSPSFHPSAEQPFWSLLRKNLSSKDSAADWYIIIDSNETFGSRESREAIIGVLTTHESGVAVFSSRVLIVLKPLESRYVTMISAAAEHAKELQKDTIFMVYQLCFALDRLAMLFISRFPAWLRIPLTLLLRMPLYWISRLPLSTFVRRLANRGSIVSQSKTVSEAMTKANETDNIGGHIGLVFTGSFAVVTKSYGPEHEWCVE